MQVESSVFVSYYDNELSACPSFYLVGIRPFGLQSSPIEVKTHYSIDLAIEDYRSRICR